MSRAKFFHLSERRAYRELQDPADRDGKRDPKSKRRARQLRAKARVKP
jgi:hypothetical protein